MFYFLFLQLDLLVRLFRRNITSRHWCIFRNNSMKLEYILRGCKCNTLLNIGCIHSDQSVFCVFTFICLVPCTMFVVGHMTAVMWYDHKLTQMTCKIRNCNDTPSISPLLICFVFTKWMLEILHSSVFLSDIVVSIASGGHPEFLKWG